jgi:hypothetical protein
VFQLALGRVSRKGARLPAELRGAFLLKLRDETFLLREPAQHLQSCRPLRQQRLIGHLVAGLRHEDSSAVNVQEYPERGHSLNHALNGDEIVVVPGHHATSVEKGSGSEIRSTDGMASERLTRWGGPVKRFRPVSTPSWSVCKVGGDGWDSRARGRRAESVLVEAYEAELVVLRRWEEFHREKLGFMPS